MMPSPVNLSTVPPKRCTTAADRSTNSVMISRSRSAPTAAAMSIEWTTSANKTVTCLFSAAVAAGLTDAPHLLQNRESGGSSVPHDPHNSPAAVTTPRPSSTSVSCHRWSTMSGLPLVPWRRRPKEVMAMVRRNFDREFREGAVRIVRETGRPIAQVARERGLHEGTLGRWVNLDRRARDGEGPLSESERDELNRLRKENAELAMERDVLKRSAALWVKEAMRR